MLDADVGPCSADPAITVDSGTLDLAGFTVRCAEAATSFVRGILVTGKGGRVANGRIEGCSHALLATGTRHVVEAIEADSGLAISGDSNRLMRSRVRLDSIGANGVGIGGSHNLVLENQTVGGQFGFIVAGNRNELRNNAARSISCDDRGGCGCGVGFKIKGTGHVVDGNLASGVSARDSCALERSGSGFVVGEGFYRESNYGSRKVILSNNTAEGCSWAGFVVTGIRHQVSGNKAVGNQYGFEVGGPHTLVNNEATDNGTGFTVGCLLSGANCSSAGPTLRANRALSNGTRPPHVARGRDPNLDRIGSRGVFPWHGFRLGERTRAFVDNVAEGNLGYGITIANRHPGLVMRNTVRRNSAHGIHLDGAILQAVRDNVVEDNGADGIRIEDGNQGYYHADRNRITRNTVSGHRAPFADLSDEQAGCGKNRWRGNMFTTRTQDCTE